MSQSRRKCFKRLEMGHGGACVGYAISPIQILGKHSGVFKNDWREFIGMF